MKAILVKYLPATNTKGSRVKAMAVGVKPLIIGYHSPHNNPFSDAAVQLCVRMGWKGTLVAGGLPDESGQVFTFKGGEEYPIPEIQEAQS